MFFDKFYVDNFSHYIKQKDYNELSGVFRCWTVSSLPKEERNRH